MDVVLAILVLGAVIFFGALVSAGNERQRKALDGIREQTALWAMQDLRLKRERLARDVKVNDPQAWLNRVVVTALGENLDLTISEVFENPQALVCLAKDGRRLVFSPVAPDEVWRAKRDRRNRLSQNDLGNLLWSISRKNEKYELSILNAGILFDLEMPFTWKALTGKDTVRADRLWLYLL